MLMNDFMMLTNAVHNEVFKISALEYMYPSVSNNTI